MRQEMVVRWICSIILILIPVAFESRAIDSRDWLLTRMEICTHFRRLAKVGFFVLGYQDISLNQPFPSIQCIGNSQCGQSNWHVICYSTNNPCGSLVEYATLLGASPFCMCCHSGG